MIDAEHILHSITRGEAYRNALREPLPALLRSEYVPVPLAISQERGGQMALSRHAGIDKESVVVVANTHALSGANSHAYVDGSHAPDIAAIMDIDRMAYSLRMGLYTKKGDTLFVESTDAQATQLAYQTIRTTLEAIGISIAEEVTVVDSVSEQVADLRGKKPIIATFLEPSYLASFGRTHEESVALFHEGLRNVAGYTKDGAQQLWEHHGIPTPSTRYFNLSQQSTEEVAQEIREGFVQYDSYVINTNDGAGGDGVQFVDKSDLEEVLSRFGHRDIQVQGKLPLVESPCVIANITDEGVGIQMISRQRIVNGAHAGNEWISDEINTNHLPEEFWRINREALESLREVGIRGQVNVDSLIISDETRERFGLDHSVLMREANIRPAASSVILRIRQGNILGQPIARIHTQASVQMPLEDFTHPDFAKLLQGKMHEGMVAVAFNFNLHDPDPTHQKTSLAFCGTKDISSEELHEFEMEIRREIIERSYLSQVNKRRRS